MKLKKLLQGTAFAAIAAACMIISPSVQADAAAADTVNLYTSGPTVAVDTQKGELKVASISTDKEIMVGYATQGKKSGKTTLTVKQWDIYDKFDSNTLTVDLSSLANTKDNYIEVMAPGHDPVIIKIPAAAKANVITYAPGTDELEFKAGANKGSAAAVKYFEYRTGYSDWTMGTVLADGKATVGFEKYQEQGATLYLRTTAYNKTTGATTDSKTQLDADDVKVYAATDLNTELTVQKTTTTLPGKETKLKIAKKANGPKVAAQYAKGTLNLPAKSEYRLLVKGATGTGMDFVKATGKTEPLITDNASAQKNVKVEDILKTGVATGGTAPTEGSIEVRVKATEKKPASKWTSVALVAPAELTAAEMDSKNNDTTAAGAYYINTLEGSDAAGWQDKAKTRTPALVTKAAGGTAKYGDYGVKNAVITNGKTDTTKETYLTVKYDAVKVKSDKYTGSLVFDNSKGTDSYEIIVSDKADVPAADAKGAKTVKAGKSLTIKNVADQSWVFIRKAGDNKATNWVGKYTKFGVVDFPKEKVIEKKS